MHSIFHFSVVLLLVICSVKLMQPLYVA